MPLSSIALVLAAALIHATWNLMAKRAAPAGPAFVFAYNLFSVTLYAPWALWLLAHGGVPHHWNAGAALLLSATIHLAYSLCLQRGYQRADLSVVYPVARGTGPMLSSLAAFALLGEMPTLRGLAGLIAVVGGIALIATQGSFTAFMRPGGQTGVRWGTATGGLIASYTVVDAWTVKVAGVLPVVLDWFSNLFRFLLLAPVVLRDRPRAIAAMRGHWGRAFWVGALSPLAYILVLLALRRGAPLSVVAPLRETSMMVGALLGMAVLREPVGRARLGGCALLTLGAVLLAG